MKYKILEELSTDEFLVRIQETCWAQNTNQFTDVEKETKLLMKAVSKVSESMCGNVVFESKKQFQWEVKEFFRVCE